MFNKNDKSRKENPQKLTQLSSRSHPRHLVGKSLKVRVDREIVLFYLFIHLFIYLFIFFSFDLILRYLSLC